MIDPNVTLKMESRKMYDTTVNCVNQTLDSQGICFLCLRDINFVNDFVLAKPSSIGNVFKLTSIFRFLKLDVDKVVPTKDYNNSKSKRGDLTVSLCQECAIIAKKFNALHQTLELTKIRLTECVERVHELMTEAENDCDRVEEMMERMTDLGVSRGDIFDAPHATIIESLRKEIIMKCAIKVKTAKPRVQVKRLTWEQTKKVQMDRPTIVKLEPEPQPQLNPSFENPDSCTPSSIEVTMSVNEDGCDDDDRHGSSFYRRENANLLKKPSLNSSPPKSHSEKTIIKSGFPHYRTWPCPCCPAILSQSRKLDDHIIRFHCEHYFLALRDPSVSPDQFIKLANHLLFKDQEDQMKSYAEKGTASCPYCSKIFSYNSTHKLVPLKVHLVRAHHQRLAEEVVEIQRDPNFREKLNLAVSESDGFTCSCGLYIPSRKLLSHQLHNCPNREKRKYKLKRKAETSIVQLGAASAKVNKKGDSTITNGATTGSNHAPSSFPLSVRPISRPELTAGKNLVLKKKRIRIKKSCPACCAVLSNSWSLREHLIRFHREQFFGSCRDPSISPDKFMKLVNHLLFKDQDELDELQHVENGTISCPYCDKPFVSHATQKAIPLINHMINDHQQRLVEKLADLQQDPSLNEKLESAIAEAGGETCSCGSYVSTWFKLAVHKKRYCSKTGTNGCIRAGGFVRSMENPQISPRRRRRIRCHKCGLLVHSIGISNHLKMCGHQILPSSCTTTFDSSTSAIKIIGEKEKSSGLFLETLIINSETFEDCLEDQKMEQVLVDPLADVTVSTDYPSLDAISSIVKLE